MHKFKKKIINPTENPNLHVLIKSIFQTTSTFSLNLRVSNSKFAKEATVFILYSISSAKPPAFSQVFLPIIIPVLNEVTKIKEKLEEYLSLSNSLIRNYEKINKGIQILNKDDSKSKIVYEDLPADDPCKRKPDITLAKEKIKWEPVVQLREGLQKTIDYFRMIKELDTKKE